MKVGKKRDRNEEDDLNMEAPSKRLRPDSENSVDTRRSIFGRLWDATSGHLSRAYRWLMHSFPFSRANISPGQSSESSSQDIVSSNIDDDDPEIICLEPQKTLVTQLPASEPPSVLKQADFVNPKKGKTVSTSTAIGQQHSGSIGGLRQYPVLSDVYCSNSRKHCEKLLSASSHSRRSSIEEVSSAYISTPSANVSPWISSASCGSLLSSKETRVQTRDSFSGSSGSSSKRLDPVPERTVPYSSAPHRMNVTTEFPLRALTPTLTSRTYLHKPDPLQADESYSSSHIVPHLTHSKTRSVEHFGVGTRHMSAASTGDEKPHYSERQQSKSDSANTASLDFYPSKSSWLEQWKLNHEMDKADFQSRLQAAQKYYNLQHEQRTKAEDQRHRNLEGLLKSLERTRLSPPHEGEQELNLNFTEQQLQKLKQVWTGGRMDEVFSQAFNIKITRGDLMTLHRLEWLNDEVINFYLNMVADQVNSQTQCKLHLFTSFFYTNLLSKGYSGVRRWTRRVDIFSKDLILFPVHLGMHWCLASIDFRRKEICYFDSLKGNNLTCFTLLSDYLVSEAKDKKQMEYDVSDWTFIAPKDIPAQYNGSDCGVFTCMYARHKAKNKPFLFSQEDMPHIRMMMVLEILSKQFL